MCVRRPSPLSSPSYIRPYIGDSISMMLACNSIVDRQRAWPRQWTTLDRPSSINHLDDPGAWGRDYISRFDKRAITPLLPFANHPSSKHVAAVSRSGGVRAVFQSRNLFSPLVSVNGRFLPRWRQGRGWVADREQMRCISYGNNLNDRRYCNSPPEDDEATKGGEEAARRMKERRGGKKVATRNGNNKIWRSRELGERGMWVQRETGWGQVGRGRREDRVF